VADDLHDILGHALEVVAFKSELAARLQDVDGARARAEMEEVQRVARESLSEVRALVRDTRPTDLVDELAGARACSPRPGSPSPCTATRRRSGRPPATCSAGCCGGDDERAAPRPTEPLHDRDRGGRRGRPARGRQRRRAAPGDGSGTGLARLDRYLREHAGRLDAGPTDDGRFRVDARIPAAVR
jgi:two-component system sensor histidine kinase DesK